MTETGDVKNDGIRDFNNDIYDSNLIKSDQNYYTALFATDEIPLVIADLHVPFNNRERQPMARKVKAKFIERHLRSDFN